eukprot:CAMPEP_0183753606 /NCGR_PEP_ID=MMETSP0739-20130205/3049_1 /TAXON_ID=385413 /ORGANISM="Thalassiosira miniscula, Strain CCMP1093" /LENGTH=36 /DNA_ID= /DNA_START= /DNA_END= /DNA_ORIENTATION=
MIQNNSGDKSEVGSVVCFEVLKGFPDTFDMTVNAEE